MNYSEVSIFFNYSLMIKTLHQRSFSNNLGKNRAHYSVYNVDNYVDNLLIYCG